LYFEVLANKLKIPYKTNSRGNQWVGQCWNDSYSILLTNFCLYDNQLLILDRSQIMSLGGLNNCVIVRGVIKIFNETSEDIKKKDICFHSLCMSVCLSLCRQPFEQQSCKDRRGRPSIYVGVVNLLAWNEITTQKIFQGTYLFLIYCLNQNQAFIYSSCVKNSHCNVSYICLFVCFGNWGELSK